MNWETILAAEQRKPYYENIFQTIHQDTSQQYTIYPPHNLMLNALDLTPFHTVKVVILGQDPYHGPGEANGLAFSVSKGIKVPPSLRNIFKELQDDLQCEPPECGDLTPWAKQGVLLLNTSLSVRHKAPMSHSHIGWQVFTDTLIQAISDQQPFVVFILWGSHAQSKAPLIDHKHAIIRSVHPSPLSAYRGFFGSKPFSKANLLLKENQLDPIKWAL